MELNLNVNSEPIITEKLCTVCNELIPSKRLAVVPDASMCVTCLEYIGDVPVIKRYDGYVGEDVFHTMFFSNSYIEHEINREIGRRLFNLELEEVEEKLIPTDKILCIEDELIDALDVTVGDSSE